MKGSITLKECVIKDGPCTNCKECTQCDLDKSKVCDNCGKCIESNAESRAIQIEDIILDL